MICQLSLSLSFFFKGIVAVLNYSRLRTRAFLSIGPIRQDICVNSSGYFNLIFSSVQFSGSVVSDSATP